MRHATSDGAPRSRRAVVLGGALALVVVFVGAAFATVPRVERDLARRTRLALANEGLRVQASFDGQDATLHCEAPLKNPTKVAGLVLALRGVHVVHLEPSCAGGGGGFNGGGTSSTATSATTADTQPLVTVPDTQPIVTVPDSSTTTTTLVPAAPVVRAVLADGKLTFEGAVADDAQHLTLLAPVLAVLDPANVIDHLVVDPTAAVSETVIAQFGTLAAAMPSTLVSGEVAWDGTTLSAKGVDPGYLWGLSFVETAKGVGVAADLVERSKATADEAAQVEHDLNALVAAQPILFDRGKTTISPLSQATLQEVAGIAKRYGGVLIQVQGHTDSEGDATKNQTLSEQRAAAVSAALADLGVPAGDMVSVGFGETQPVLDPSTGAPDAAKSRRVVFAVTVTG